MTNINCSSNCFYQKDGKCQYSQISVSSLCTNSKCAYYKQKNPEH
ncbi:MAG: hydroxymyristoyl-ACP dehydratase [Clostridia bacterium]|nr:hydroxymyristoyl-ACP dehydratase [Clostridia bacterium]